MNRLLLSLGLLATLVSTNPLRPFEITAAIHDPGYGHRRCDIYGIADDNTTWTVEYSNRTSGVPGPYLKKTDLVLDNLPLVFTGSDLVLHHLNEDSEVIRITGNNAPVNLGGGNLATVSAGYKVSTGRELIGLGIDGHIWYMAWWTKTHEVWRDLGGSFASEPAAANFVGHDFVEVWAVEKGSGKLLHKTYPFSGTDWVPGNTEWDTLSVGPFHGGVLTSVYAGEPDISKEPIHVWSLKDKTLMHTSSLGGNYTGWESLGGNFETIPRVVHVTSSRIDVVGQDASSLEYVHKVWTSGKWTSQWSSLGEGFPAPPALGVWDKYGIFAFGVAANGTLCMQQWSVDEPRPSRGRAFAHLGNIFASQSPAMEEL